MDDDKRLLYFLIDIQSVLDRHKMTLSLEVGYDGWYVDIDAAYKDTHIGTVFNTEHPNSAKIDISETIKELQEELNEN